MAELLQLTNAELSYLESLIPYASELELEKIKALLTGTTETVTTEQMVASPTNFRNALQVECNHESTRLASIIAPWQRDDFAALDAACLTIAGRGCPPSPKFRAYLERGRGHSKTTDIAIVVCWLLFASARKVSGVVAAGDSDQAKLLRDAIDTLCRVNPFLSECLEVQRSIVVNKLTGSEVRIISSDAMTSYGMLLDFIVCDELTHWTVGKGEHLWHSLFSTAAKKQNCLLLIISNAGLGMGTSWQWRIRESARTSDNWHFSRLDGPQAGWVSQTILDEQARILPPSVYRRLWDNEWISTSGDALEEADIMGCLDPTASPMSGEESQYGFMAGVDIGVKRDLSAMVVLAVDQERQRVRLADCQSWSPKVSGAVSLDMVESAIFAAAKKFPGLIVAYDPKECEHIAQHMRLCGVDMRPMHFTPNNCSIMASAILQLFRSRAVTLYRDTGLIADLGKLNIVQKSYGFKLEAPHDSSGHADRAIAFAIALAAAMQWLGSYQPAYDDGLGESVI